MSELARHLAELQRTHTLKRTLCGVVREELATILAARAAGYGYEQICQALKPMGIEVTARRLRDVVYRVRRNSRTSADMPQQPSANPAGMTEHAGRRSGGAAVLQDVPAETPRADASQPSTPAAGAGPGFVRQILSSPSELEDLARRFRESRGAPHGSPR